MAKSGRPTACRVEDEYPERLGFGEAALNLTDRYHAAPDESWAAGSALRLTFEWRHPKFSEALSAFAAGDFDRVSEISSDSIRWRIPPRPQDLSGPADAAAEMNCFIGVDGGLGPCRFSNVTPVGNPWLMSGIRMGRYVVVEPTTADGIPTAGRRVTLRLGGSDR